MPHTAKVVDYLCFIKSMNTDQITRQREPRTPGLVVMISQGSGNRSDQPFDDRLWGSGFLPSKYQGVKFRAGGDPVLYLSNPPGVDPAMRRRNLDDLAEMNQVNLQEYRDPEIKTRVFQYEMASKIQTSVPELTDLSKESERTFELYGPDSKKPGTFAANCLLAERNFDSSSFSIGAGTSIPNCPNRFEVRPRTRTRLPPPWLPT